MSKPIKIDSFSFDENGQILRDKIANKVYFNDCNLKLKNFKIDLKRNFDRYIDEYEKYKYLFRSNILLYFNNKYSGTLRQNMDGADFFVSRGLLKYIAGAFQDNININLWAFYLNGVIVIADEIYDEKKSQHEEFINYIGLNFENITCSKKKEFHPYYGRLVNSWEQYKEVNIIDIFDTFDSTSEIYRVAYSCEIDAFDRNTGKPLELKTKYRDPKNNNNFFNYKSAIGTYFQCMLGNVSEIVVGVKGKNFIVNEVCKYQTDKLLKVDGIKNAIENCCQQLYNNLRKIKNKVKNNNYVGCIKIVGNKNCRELIFKYYLNYPRELENLFTPDFCRKFSI